MKDLTRYRRENRDAYKSECIDAMEAISVFYGIEALKVQVELGGKFEPFRKSHEKLLNDIIEYQNTLSDTLANMLYKYTVLTCFAELNHHKDQSSLRYKGNKISISIDDRLSRDVLTKMSLHYNPTNILETYVDGFDKKYCWNSSFGGKAWQVIAKHGLTYGKYSNKEFCDTSFSLSHNTSPYVNKSFTKIFYISDTTLYKSLLDTKFFKTPMQTIDFILDYCYIDCDFLKFARRAYNLGMLDLYSDGRLTKSYRKGYHIELMNEIKENYFDVTFGSRILKVKPFFPLLKSVRERNFYERINEGNHVMFKENKIHSNSKNKFENFIIKRKRDDGILIIECLHGIDKEDEFFISYKDLFIITDNNKSISWKENIKREVK